QWEKDGGKWFYLDDDGNMATNQWVEDDYYVGEDGAMITNGWVKTLADDEDLDSPDETGEHWYYFGAKGKKISATNGDYAKKTIGGKTYYFDNDGKMYTGWHEFKEGEAYYLGGEDEGWAAKNQWLWLEKSGLADDDDGDDTLSQTNVLGCTDADTDTCDDEGWYWFDSAGKVYHKNALKTIKGKKFRFNDHGQMLYEWINTNTTLTHSSNAQLDGNLSEDDRAATIGEMLWFKENGDDADSGSRYKGWQYIAGSQDVGKDGDTNWYYFKDGKAKHADRSKDLNGLRDGFTDKAQTNPNYLARKKEKISWDGKTGTFCFDEFGKMKTGLQYIDGHTYYFNDDGYMQTGKVANVEEADGDTFNYYFNTKNSGKGQGYTGEKDGYLYFNGKRLEADDDYKVFYVDGNYYVVNNKGKCQKTLKNKDLETPNGVKENVTIGSDGKIGKTYKLSNGDTSVVSNKDKKDGTTEELGTLKDVACVPHIQLEDTDNYIIPKQLNFDKAADDTKGQVLTPAATATLESEDYLTMNMFVEEDEENNDEGEE
ncbi:hypothetical protein ACTQ56_12950, partial [[Clostridium] aminophilum]|uniref:hypothetical protein n=1 Tax=[Clostridium] aminophilum TaxID=1526 RepID=UPI003F9591F3